MNDITDEELFFTVKHSNFCFDFVNKCFIQYLRPVKYDLNQILKLRSVVEKKREIEFFISTHKKHTRNTLFILSNKWISKKYYKQSLPVDKIISTLSEELKLEILSHENIYNDQFPELLKKCFSRSELLSLISNEDKIFYDAYFADYGIFKAESAYLKVFIDKIELLAIYSLIKEAESEFNKLNKSKAVLNSYTWNNQENLISLKEFCRNLKSNLDPDTRLKEIEACFRSTPLTEINPLKVLEGKLSDIDLVYLVRHVLMKKGHMLKDNSWVRFVAIFKDINGKNLNVASLKAQNYVIEHGGYSIDSMKKVSRLIVSNS